MASTSASGLLSGRQMVVLSCMEIGLVTSAYKSLIASESPDDRILDYSLKWRCHPPWSQTEPRPPGGGAGAWPAPPPPQRTPGHSGEYFARIK